MAKGKGRIVYSTYPCSEPLLKRSEFHKLHYSIEKIVNANSGKVMLTEETIGKSGKTMTKVNIGDLDDIMDEFISGAMCFEFVDISGNLFIKAEYTNGERVARLKALTEKGYDFYDFRLFRKDRTEIYAIKSLLKHSCYSLSLHPYKLAKQLQLPL